LLLLLVTPLGKRQFLFRTQLTPKFKIKKKSEGKLKRKRRPVFFFTWSPSRNPVKGISGYSDIQTNDQSLMAHFTSEGGSTTISIFLF
jgi:hypothetical protein